MNPPRMMAEDIRCLGHTDPRGGLCERKETCRRFTSGFVVNSAPGTCFTFLFRVCQPEAHDQYLEVRT